MDKDVIKTNIEEYDMIFICYYKDLKRIFKINKILHDNFTAEFIKYDCFEVFDLNDEHISNISSNFDDLYKILKPTPKPTTR